MYVQRTCCKYIYANGAAVAHTHRDHPGRAVSHKRLVQILDLPHDGANRYNDGEIGEPADV